MLSCPEQIISDTYCVHIAIAKHLGSTACDFCAVLLQETVPSSLMTFNLVVSIFWATYNAIPAVLLLHYACSGNKGLRHNIRVCSIISVAVMLGVLISVWLLLPPSYDFGKVTSLSWVCTLLV